MVIGRWLRVFAGQPVMGLLDAFAPLRWWVVVRFGRGLVLMSLHGDSAEQSQLTGDVGGTRRAFRLREKVGRRDQAQFEGERGFAAIPEYPVQVGDGAAQPCSVHPPRWPLPRPFSLPRRNVGGKIAALTETTECPAADLADGLIRAGEMQPCADVPATVRV